MIFGSYPCCDGDLTLSIPDGVETPVIQREICPHCGAVVWHKLSIIDPESWTDVEFQKIYEVDAETKSVKLRYPPPKPDMSPELQAMMDEHMNRVIEAAADEIARDFLKGSSQ